MRSNASTFTHRTRMLPRMTAPAPATLPDPDPRPEAPREPELEDCCGSGCAICVFDAYQIALENHERALKAWEARHPELAGKPAQA
jgi:hypothetical protein